MAVRDGDVVVVRQSVVVLLRVLLRTHTERYSTGELAVQSWQPGVWATKHRDGHGSTIMAARHVVILPQSDGRVKCRNNKSFLLTWVP